MYESYYGLGERPFDLTPNPRFLFLSTRQREAFSHLLYGLTTARGLTLLVGEAGTGKTTLVQAALADAARAAITCVLLSNPTLTREEFYEYLADGFGLAPAAGRSKTRFLFELRRLLLDRHEAGDVTALVLDEAQSLPHTLLEEVRLLSNIETPTHKLLNLVLAGQPELSDRLNESNLRQLKQRVSLRCELTPFDLRETAAYIAGRLRIAGGTPAAIFSREAIAAIFEASAGVPRTVNVICDNALITGFATHVKPVSSAIIQEVVRDFDLRRSPGNPRPAVPLPPAEAESLPSGPSAMAEASQGSGSAAPMFRMFSRNRRYSGL